MGGQTYERVPHNEDHVNDHSPVVPDSPPPSFRSRSSSLTSRRQGPYHEVNQVDQTLEDTFGDDNDNEGEDDRQLLIRTATTNASPSSQDAIPSNTQLPTFPTAGRSGPTAPSNDGVFANLNAKPEKGEKLEEHPPSYEQAAADATPPYWETTILAPGMSSDEVYIDGLPVGSFFSFAWNGIISMAFQLVGFLLTYLLHTTHAAKNGSRAGLGVTMINYGFTLRSMSRKRDGGADYTSPSDPNKHDFDPSDSAAAAIASAEDHPVGSHGFAGEWLSLVLMILGWVILIKSVSDFIRARRHEQLILQSPDRGLSVPIVATGEHPEQAV